MKPTHRAAAPSRFGLEVRMIQSAIRCLAMLVVLGIAAIPAHAFDGKREGFFMDVAIGPSLTDFRQGRDYYVTYVFWRGDRVVDSTVIVRNRNRQIQLGVSTNLMLGFGLNEHVVVSYHNRVAWFGTDQHMTVAAGVTGLALTYYFAPAAPSFYVTSVLGLGIWRALEKGTGGGGYLSIVLAGGYEFRQHFAIEGALSDGRAGYHPADPLDTRARSAHLTLVWKGY